MFSRKCRHIQFSTLQEPCHNTWHMLMLAFLVIFWKACHLRWCLCFYGLSHTKGAYASYFNEYGSTCMAQSYHIHEVARLPFEPNTPPEMRQGGGRPKHKPQQREDAKQSCRQSDDVAESEDKRSRWDWREKNPQGQMSHKLSILPLPFPSSSSFSCLFLLLPFPSPSASPSSVHSSWSRWKALIVTGQYDFL